MSNGPIQGLRGTTSTRGRVDGELPPEALQTGALTFFEDGEVSFAGDGVHTPADVTARVIQRLAESGDLELQPLVNSRDAAVFAAQNALEENNPTLRNQDAEAPVPEGTVFLVQTNDLKSLLAPFKNRLDELRELVIEGRTGMGGRNQATGHGVFTQGRTLPVGGEPDPDPAEVMARLGIKVD